MDDNGDKRISKDELKYGLRDYGLELTPVELDHVFLYFDRDRSGAIDMTEFLVGLRGPMNARRVKMIQLAFNVLDTDNSGTVSVDEVMSKYDFSWNPDVKDGKKTIQQAAKEFMNTWDRGEVDGQITWEEFEEYYKDISASIDDDDYFELMMRNAWRIPGGKGMAANTANRRVLVTKADGSQTVETVENELGLRRGDVDGIRSRLQKQGVSATNVDLYGYQDSTSKGSGSRPANLGGNRPSNPNNSINPRVSSASNNNRSQSAGPRGRVNNLVANEPSTQLPTRNTFDRIKAATKLEAAFRGLKARKEAEQVKRKQNALLQRQADEMADANRPKARTILRPKGNSYIGF